MKLQTTLLPNTSKKSKPITSTLFSEPAFKKQLVPKKTTNPYYLKSNLTTDIKRSNTATKKHFSSLPPELKTGQRIQKIYSLEQRVLETALLEMKFSNSIVSKIKKFINYDKNAKSSKIKTYPPKKNEIPIRPFKEI